MPHIRWKTAGRLLLAAFFAYAGVNLLGHVVQSYVRWGYPPWSHIPAGALFLAAAVLLPFRRTCWLGALAGLCVMVPAMATCALHGDYGHAVQGPPIIALLVWLALDSPKRGRSARKHDRGDRLEA